MVSIWRSESFRYTGWISTERNWHQDDYLNPPRLKSHYLAAWIALEDIHPDSGPFQYVPGSHRWPVLTKARALALLPEAHRARSDWTLLTQDAVSAASEAEIAARGAQVVTHLPGQPAQAAGAAKAFLDCTL